MPLNFTSAPIQMVQFDISFVYGGDQMKKKILVFLSFAIIAGVATGAIALNSGNTEADYAPPLVPPASPETMG